MPERICPVIIPGRETMPMVSILFMVGRMALSKASLTTPRAAAAGVAPSMREFSTSSRRSRIPLHSLLAPRAMPVMELPTIIPEIGMQYWGSNQGLIRSTTKRNTAAVTVYPAAMERQTRRLSSFDISTFTRLTALYMAKESITASMSRVSHQLGFSNTNMRIYPMTVSWMVMRVAAMRICLSRRMPLALKIRRRRSTKT